VDARLKTNEVFYARCFANAQIITRTEVERAIASYDDLDKAKLVLEKVELDLGVNQYKIREVQAQIDAARAQIDDLRREQEELKAQKKDDTDRLESKLVHTSPQL